jgi:lipopolysaccharide/colanic/teichoic acid biosynthesis glycosyltransferase
MLRTRRGDDGLPAAARLTPVTRIVRALSLDHVPMLLNVVRGDLSLVGPRPMEPDRVDLSDPRWRRVLSIRPGLVSYAILASRS